MAQILLQKTAATSIATPPAGKETLFIDVATNHFSKKDSTGTVYDLEAGATYTDNDAINAIGGILIDTGTIDFTFIAGTISATVKSDSITNSNISTAAAITYSKLNLANSIVNNDIAPGAAISLSKLITLTDNRVLISNGSGVIDVSTVTSSELQFLKNTSSNIQNQIDAKQALDSDLTAIASLTDTGIIARTATGAMSTRKINAGTGVTVINGDGVVGDPTIALSNTAVTAGTYGSTTQVPILTVDDKGRVVSASNTSITSSVIGDLTETVQDVMAMALTDTETIDFLYDDVLNEITAEVKVESITNTQISATADIALSKLESVTVDKVLISNSSGEIDTSTITPTELNALSGIIGGTIQTQLDNKQPLDSDLTALASITTNGFLTRTALGSATARSLSPGNGINITNQTGVSGDPTIGLTDTGVVASVYGNTNQIPVVTVDAQGRITSATQVPVSSATTATNFSGTLSGDVTGTQTATSISTTTVTGKLLTGFSSSAGTVSASDTILQAINKLDGNIAGKEPTITAGTSLQYYRGDKTFQTLNAAAIPDFGTAAQSAVYPVAAANTTGFATIATSGSFGDLTNSPISSSGQMSTSLETAVVSLTDAPTIAIDASLGNTFTVTLGGNRTLGTPTNPVSGQKIIVRVTQDGVGGRQLSYSSGWSLGIDFVGLPLSTSPGVTDYIGAIYNTLTSKWDVVSIMRGY